ncbi:MAG: T9SS type A sorting domain-containing protein, partial [bacterium]
HSAKVYDLRGVFIGAMQTSQPVEKLQMRILPAKKILARNGQQDNLAAGIYFVAPSNFIVNPYPASAVAGFGFENVTAKYLPQDRRSSGDVETADINNDGRIDVVFSSYAALFDTLADYRPRLWIQTAQGNFVDETVSRLPRLNAPTLDLELFDAEGDGDVDIFLGGYAGRTYHLSAALLINNGTGVFSDESLARLPQLSNNGFVYFAEAARLDDDPSQDLVVNVAGRIDTVNHQFIKPEIWLNNGSGYFTRDTQGRLSDTKDYGFLELVIADLDMDSRNDLVFGNTYSIITGELDPTPLDTLSGQTAFYRNRGDGFFIDETVTRMPASIERSTRDLAVADVDIDGDLDMLEVGLFFGSQDPQVRLLMNDGTGRYVFSTNSLPTGLTGWFNDAKFALLDDDRYPDLFMTKVQLGGPSFDVLLINNGNGTFQDASNLLPQVLDFSVACALFDHEQDKDNDIVIANSGIIADSTGQNALYHNLLHETTGVDAGNDPMPKAFALLQNHPNPFNPSTTISYFLPRAGNVKLAIYDLVGQWVGTLVDGYKTSGAYATAWNANHIAPGIYFFQISVDGQVLVRKKAVYLR